MNLIQLPHEPCRCERRVLAQDRRAPMLPLAGICIGGLLSHFCLTNAYRHGDAIMVVPLDFLRIPLIAFVGWQLYGEPLDPFVLSAA